MKRFILIMIVIGVTCKQHDPPAGLLVISIPPDTIAQHDPLLRIVNGKYLYKGAPFSGFVRETFANGTIAVTQSFYKGREEGWLNTYYPDGVPESRRYYHEGEKDSVHTGWWQNGRKRFEYHFSKGVYQGNFTEWYAGGQLFTHIIYKDGADLSGKSWRENGKVFMSFIAKNGRRYGLMNAQPCYTLKNEKGEYIERKAKKSPL